MEQERSLRQNPRCASFTHLGIPSRQAARRFATGGRSFESVGGETLEKAMCGSFATGKWTHLVAMPSPVHGLLCSLSEQRDRQSRGSPSCHYNGSSWDRMTFDSTQLNPTPVWRTSTFMPQPWNHFGQLLRATSMESQEASPCSTTTAGSGRRSIRSLQPQPGSLTGRGPNEIYLADDDMRIYRFDGKNWSVSDSVAKPMITVSGRSPAPTLSASASITSLG